MYRCRYVCMYVSTVASRHWVSLQSLKP
jgi:hypothetical protein